MQISWGKPSVLPRTSVGFTVPAFDGYGLRDCVPARPAGAASYPVPVRRIAISLRASFRRSLAVPPLRFTRASPPSGCTGDFHPQDAGHAQHTRWPAATAFRRLTALTGGQPSSSSALVSYGKFRANFLPRAGFTRIPTATDTVDWFHVVQLFTKAVDEVRRAEVKRSKLPKALRWAVLKRADGRLTEAQVTALAELEASDLFTAVAWRIKEKLRWVRQAQSIQAARWRITNFLRHAKELLDPDPILDPVRRALATVETQSTRILQRWTSSHSNARLEGLNGLFQAARARARGYRNVTTFATIIYLIAAPLGNLFEST